MNLEAGPVGGGPDHAPTMSEPASAEGHLAPAITYLGTLAEVTLGSGGPPTDAFGDMSNPP